MAMTKKREESSRQVDHLIMEALNNKDSDGIDDSNEEHLNELSDRLEERLAQDDEGSPKDPVTTEGNTESILMPVSDDSGGNQADVNNTRYGDNATHDGLNAKTLEEALNAIDDNAKATMNQTMHDRDRIMMAHAMPFMQRKMERSSTPQSRGYIWFCIIAMVIGLAWAITGIVTKGVWPIPLFGIWNTVCGAFCVLYGGFMLMDWRK